MVEHARHEPARLPLELAAWVHDQHLRRQVLGVLALRLRVELDRRALARVPARARDVRVPVAVAVELRQQRPDPLARGFDDDRVAVVAARLVEGRASEYQRGRHQGEAAEREDEPAHATSRRAAREPVAPRFLELVEAVLAAQHARAAGDRRQQRAANRVRPVALGRRGEEVHVLLLPAAGAEAALVLGVAEAVVERLDRLVGAEIGDQLEEHVVADAVVRVRRVEARHAGREDAVVRLALPERDRARRRGRGRRRGTSRAPSSASSAGAAARSARTRRRALAGRSSRRRGAGR